MSLIRTERLRDDDFAGGIAAHDNDAVGARALRLSALASYELWGERIAPISVVARPYPFDKTRIVGRIQLPSAIIDLAGGDVARGAASATSSSLSGGPSERKTVIFGLTLRTGTEMPWGKTSTSDH